METYLAFLQRLGIIPPVKVPDNITPVPAPPRWFNKSSAMFLMISLYTIAYLGMMARELFLHGSWTVPAGLMPVYITLLGVDAADQELRRWTGAEEEPRQRTLFVYPWALFYLTASILHIVRPEFNLPSDLNLVMLLVLGIFFGSCISQAIFEWRSNNIFYTLP